MMRILFQTRCLPHYLLLLVCAITLLYSCNNKAKNSPEGYDLGKPQKMELGKVLNEISGLTYNTENGSLLAIADSKRKIFQLSLQKYKLKDLVDKFAEQGDFEDLVKIGRNVFVLVSDGTIIQVPLNSEDTVTTENVIETYPFWSQDKNDFETLYYDSLAKGLVMLCKSCEKDKNTGYKSAFRFDLAKKEFDSTAFFRISNDSVRTNIKNEDADFKPSAAAIHPIDKRLYILSSAGQLLVISDTRGKVLETYSLNPDQHPQAEGIAFSPNGTMFISNEGKYGKATLQVFPYINKLANDKKRKK